MCAGEFQLAYTDAHRGNGEGEGNEEGRSEGKGAWDSLVTCFFIDTVGTSSPINRPNTATTRQLKNLIAQQPPIHHIHQPTAFAC